MQLIFQDVINGTWFPPKLPCGHARVYMITCMENSKAYIGVTMDLRFRFKRHLKHDEVVGRALRRHDPKNFSVEILHSGPNKRKQCFNLERQLIKKHNTHISEGGYNVSWGGKGLTSEESQKLHSLPHVKEASRRRTKTPKWSESSARGGINSGKTRACHAGYPTHRVLSAFKAAHESTLNTRELSAALNFTWDKTRTAIGNLRRRGHRFKLLGHGTSTLQLMGRDRQDVKI